MSAMGSSTAMQAAPYLTALCVLQLLWLSGWPCAVVCYPFRTPLDVGTMPRLTIPTSGLEGCRRFRSSAVNYNTLLLEADSGRLYVGARGAVFSLNASDISASSALTIPWEASLEKKEQCLSKGKDNKTDCFNHIRFLQRFNATHLYMCGTYAFSPLCAYIDEERFVMSSQPEEGKEKCPYGPTTGYTGLIVEQQMFMASRYEFRSSPDIRLNAPSVMLKTEDAPTRWLNDADFVGSALVRESEGSGTGDDDKIYFFFTERSEEQTGSHGLGRVARVARVCKGDRGGLLTLQKRWTSFLKARLVCSLPEYDLHVNSLRSVFVLRGNSPRDTLFYGIFGLEWKNVKASAVCRFTLPEVQQAFQGPYMENENSGSKWNEYTGKIPQPRPGECITDELRNRGINLSTSLPDDVLDFVRRHPLMAKVVQPLGRRPLVFRRNTDYTQMAVHMVPGLDGHVYHVLFMGTDEGWLHKAVDVEGQFYIIEELQLFEQPQPVNSLVISPAQMSVYVGSTSGVVQLPLSTCHRYASCYDCIFARDPYCGWNGSQCVQIMSQADRSMLIQDVQLGSRGCEHNSSDGLLVLRSRAVMAGDDALLQCELTSNLATPLWTLNGSELQGYGLNSGFRTGTDGLLIIEARLDQRGLYTCYGVENGVRVSIVVYNVTVRRNLPPPPAAKPTEEPYGPYTHQVTTPGVLSSERTLPPQPAPLLPRSELLSPRNMEAMYISLITILGGLCVVLTVVLLYVGFCLRVGTRGQYSLRAASAAYGNTKRTNQNRRHHRNSSQLELRTVSGRCNGNGVCNGAAKQHGAYAHDGGLLQIVPGEGRTSHSNGHPPPAPPPPPPPQLHSPECEFPGGLAATLPSVLRRMNGNSYVLLRQSDSESTSPLGHSFTEELNKMLEKRKHTQLLPRPDESSV